MKVAIVTTMVPFLCGGAEVLAASLKKELIVRGHEAQIIKFPFSWSPTQNLIDSIMAVSMQSLVNVDKVIAMKFPAYFIKHHNKTIWLVHQFRQAYDLLNTEYDSLSANYADRKIRNIIVNMDTKFFTKEGLHPIYTISDVVSDRLLRHNGVVSKPLYCPLDNSDKYNCKSYGDYLFYPSRINGSKRQRLAVEAMRYVKSGVKLVLAGKGDSGEDEKTIHQMITSYGLGDKVTYINRFITDEEKVELYSNALGVLFIPYDEDYGYITLEAFQSSKAVITCTDSGQPSAFVKSSQNGYVVKPEAKELAILMDEMYNNKENAEKMGRNAFQKLMDLDITWDNVIGRLLE